MANFHNDPRRKARLRRGANDREVVIEVPAAEDTLEFQVPAPTMQLVTGWLRWLIENHHDVAVRMLEDEDGWAADAAPLVIASGMVPARLLGREDAEGPIDPEGLVAILMVVVREAVKDAALEEGLLPTPN